MIRSYYFEQKLADIIKEELKHNFCSVSVEMFVDWAAAYSKGKMIKGKGKCKDDEKELPKKVVGIITVRNSRDALGEKGARIRLLQHKINGFFGFNEEFFDLFVQRREIEYDSDSDDASMLKGKLGKGKGRFGKGKGYNEVAEEPAKPKKAKAPKKRELVRYEVPDLEPEQWKDCALRSGKLNELLKNEKTFAPVQMILGDPVRYGVRLWREYNLRAAPQKAAALQAPNPTEVAADWGSFTDFAVGDWGEIAEDWGDPDSGHIHAFETGAQEPLSEAEKMAARAKRFGSSTSKASGSLVVKDFGTDEEVHLDNVDVGTACCADLIARLKEVRSFLPNVEPTLVLLPSGRELDPQYQISKIPAGETLKFMAITRKK